MLAQVADEQACWQAVLARDAGQDGQFVWAVRSTGVYCKPSCPARRPSSPQKVVFYPVPEVAEKFGYRPCRRCHPQQAGTGSPAVQLVRQVCQLIEAHESPLTLEQLGRELQVSPAHLQRTFKRTMGISPRQYSDACRLGRLKQALRTRGTVTTALYEAGYGSSSRLYERSDELLGMTPSAYKRGGQHMCLHYTLTGCPLGRLLLAGTERGISALYLGDEDPPLEDALAQEFPAAQREKNPEGLKEWLDEVLAFLKGQQPHLDLPLDVRATAFQWRVWQELRKIPRGKTRTYQEIAQDLGEPGAARAVGRACATNPVSLVIPCHRVLRRDGQLGGYRWGLDRKQALLDQEREGT